MFAMFRQFFNTFTTLFAALDQLAQGLLNVTTVTNEMSGTYLDQSRADREQAKINQARSLKALMNEEPSTTNVTSFPQINQQ